MEWSFILAVFVLGLYSGFKLVQYRWKRNAKEIMGIDGYKVMDIDFYHSYDNVQRYWEYLENSVEEKV